MHKIDENARKSVEASGLDSAALKLFAQWVDSGSSTSEKKIVRKASYSGLLTSVKKALSRADSVGHAVGHEMPVQSVLLCVHRTLRLPIPALVAQK